MDDDKFGKPNQMKEMINVNDQDVRGECYHRFRLPNNVDMLTVQELIKLRIETEVKRFNVQRPLWFHSLVQPEGAEVAEKGYRLKAHREIDWENQYKRAIEAFAQKSFLINVNGCDLQSLDDEIETADEVVVNFVKFSEVIGG